MYPQRELIRLAAYKVTLRRAIAIHRVQCAESARRAAQPLAMLDRMLVLWRKFSPFAMVAALPLGFLIKRKVAPRLKLLGTLMRWGPIIFTAFRRVKSTVASNNQSNSR